MNFDHVGIATDDTDTTARLYTELLGAEIVHEERFDGMRIVFLTFDETEPGYFLELLEPTDPAENGPIARYLERNGPGIHHLAVRTDDVAEALERATEMGLELLDETPRSGAWGHTIGFVHPKSTGGVLLEFVEH